VITTVSREEGLQDYTKVTFWPDFERFGMSEFEDDVALLMKRRAYDIAGSTDKSLKVKLNGEMLPVRTFQEYVDLYPTFGEEKHSAAHAKVGDRWEVCVRPSNRGFMQVSFVNSIATTKGGNHVKYIADQIIEKVIAAVKKKKGKEMDPKPYMIKPFLWVFVNCLIENPSFDSQTKETLDTTKPNFGSECNLPAKMIDYIIKSGVVERTIETANSKLTKQMQAKVKSSERGRVSGLPKLEDANDAGTRNSPKCTLILTEGDSAKALAVSGLGTVGRDRFGVFPLRGKILNVRDASMKK
jgi:Type IIA topoisomerase (DNA gyrase/topo II, topoisomerase IV), B subunit